MAKIGEIAVRWNEAEHHLTRILWLYLDTDAQTAEILTSPLRPSDREKLLKKLIKAKELDEQVSVEITEAIKLCAGCRDNRNIILHNAGGQDGEFSEKALSKVELACSEQIAVVEHMSALAQSVSLLLVQRAARQMPGQDEEGETVNDTTEWLPEAVFAAPERPSRPKLVKAAELMRPKNE